MRHLVAPFTIMLPLLCVAALALLAQVFGVGSWLSKSLLGVPVWGWAALVAILFDTPKLKPFATDLAHIRKRLYRARQRHERLARRLQQVEDSYGEDLRDLETRTMELAGRTDAAEQRFGHIHETVEGVTDRVDFLNERVTLLERPGDDFDHDETESTGTVCLHCLYEALVAGTRNPADLSRAAKFDETRTDHNARVHPDDAATRARRIWLEMEAERILSEVKPLS